MVTQIWKSKNDQTGWMPSHFQTWSSEKETENHNNHSVVIEGIPILCKFKHVNLKKKGKRNLNNDEK